jgi:hypothetical protein
MISEVVCFASLPLVLFFGIICIVQQLIIRNLRREIARNNRIRTKSVLGDLKK